MLAQRKYISDDYLWDGLVKKDLRTNADDVIIQNHTSPATFHVFNNESYGNNNTADYLCELLNAAINNPNAIPNPLAQQWLEDTIKAQTDALITGTPVIPIPTVTPTPSPTPTPSSTPTLSPTIQPSPTATTNSTSTPATAPSPITPLPPKTPSNHIQ